MAVKGPQRSRSMGATLLTLTALLCYFMATTSGVSVIPHDAHPGYSIKKFDTGTSINYRLLDSGFSQFFTMLQDGSIMTVSDLSPLVNRPIDLMVLEENANISTTHMLQLYVLDRRNILNFKMDGDVAGHIAENSVAGTRVLDVPLLQAASGLITGPITYSIIGGNVGEAFELEHSVTGDMAFNMTVRDATAGVYIVSAQPLDREEAERYVLTVQATDASGINKAVANIVIQIEDENDNSPVFTQKVYRFVVGDDSLEGDNVTTSWNRFTSVGKVEATDADGDKVAYRLVTPTNYLVIVPQTGDLLLTEEPSEEVELELVVEAHDLRTPSRTSPRPAQILFHYKPLVPAKVDLDLDLQVLEDKELHRGKRRVTRAVRPTKRIEFTESDGDTEGRNVFQLEKETDRETFKIRDENPWVTVEPNGAVRVKKKWDYEELGPEKTIDFWVTITNAEKGGEFVYY